MEDFYNNLFNIDFKEKIAALAANANDVMNSTASSHTFAIVKFILGILPFVIFILIVVTILKIRRLGNYAVKEKKAPAIKEGEFAKNWKSFIQKSQSSNISDWKVIIIELDKIFDSLLKRMGYSGDSMGDRLKQLNRVQFPDLDGIWEAHKIRNRIVHNPDYELSKSELGFVMQTYERVLRDLRSL